MMIETNVPILEVGMPISTRGQKNIFASSIMWFKIGCVWGLISQLAMAAITLLSLNYDVGSSAWFEWAIVLFFSLLHASGALVLRLVVYQFVQLVRSLDMNDKVEEHLDSLTKSFILGSLVSQRQYVAR